MRVKLSKPWSVCIVHHQIITMQVEGCCSSSPTEPKPADMSGYFCRKIKISAVRMGLVVFYSFLRGPRHLTLLCILTYQWNVCVLLPCPHYFKQVWLYRHETIWEYLYWLYTLSWVFIRACWTSVFPLRLNLPVIVKSITTENSSFVSWKLKVRVLHKKALKGVLMFWRTLWSSPRAAIRSSALAWCGQHSQDTFSLASPTPTLLEETLNWNDLPVAAGSGV